MDPPARWHLLGATLRQGGTCWARPSAKVAPVGRDPPARWHLLGATLRQGGTCWVRPSGKVAPVGCDPSARWHLLGATHLQGGTCWVRPTYKVAPFGCDPPPRLHLLGASWRPWHLKLLPKRRVARQKCQPIWDVSASGLSFARVAALAVTRLGRCRAPLAVWLCWLAV